jgi:hypothetical protein
MIVATMGLGIEGNPETPQGLKMAASNRHDAAAGTNHEE